jgi:hypothetical protein
MQAREESIRFQDSFDEIATSPKTPCCAELQESLAKRDVA